MLLKNNPDSIWHVKYVCQVCDNKPPPTMDELLEIRQYSSEEQAYNAGWRKTSDPKFCGPEDGYVWICPDCYRKVVRQLFKYHGY